MRRIRSRLDDPAKHWKFSEGDLNERSYWNAYQEAFEDLLARCSTKYAPWFVVPANHKWYRDAAVADIVTEALAEMDPKPTPVKLDVKRLRALLARRDGGLDSPLSPQCSRFRRLGTKPRNTYVPIRPVSPPCLERRLGLRLTLRLGRLLMMPRARQHHAVPCARAR